jgi:hypothetical protein
VRAENDFCGATLGVTLAPGAERLYRELLSRLKETDEAAPVPRGGWLYSTRTEKGLSYALHCRRRAAARAGDGPGPEVVVLDENALAAGHAFLDVAGVEPSPCHSLVAYAVDTSGGETYAIVFKGAEAATPRAPTFAAAVEAAEDEEEEEEEDEDDDDEDEDEDADDEDEDEDADDEEDQYADMPPLVSQSTGARVNCPCTPTRTNAKAVCPGAPKRQTAENTIIDSTGPCQNTRSAKRYKVDDTPPLVLPRSVGKYSYFE